MREDRIRGRHGPTLTFLFFLLTKVPPYTIVPYKIGRWKELAGLEVHRSQLDLR
jgi:hypothetical protein